MSHTPAPWTFHPDEGKITAREGVVIIAFVNSDDAFPCLGYDLDAKAAEAEYQSNGRLLTASPDLLTASEAVLAILSRADSTVDDWLEPLQRMRDAVRKAKGE